MGRRVRHVHSAAMEDRAWRLAAVGDGVWEELSPDEFRFWAGRDRLSGNIL